MPASTDPAEDQRTKKTSVCSLELHPFPTTCASDLRLIIENLPFLIPDQCQKFEPLLLGSWGIVNIHQIIPVPSRKSGTRSPSRQCQR